MQNKILTFIIIGVVILAVVGLVYFYGGIKPSGEIVNGYWNEATQECWSSKDNPPGEFYPADGSESMFTSCCFNKEGSQVDCNDPTIILGEGLAQAIYGAGGGAGLPGIFSVIHTITLTNGGSVDIDNIWVESATWTPPHAELTTNYAQIIGSSSSYAGNLPVGNARDFTTGLIDLTSIAGPSGSPNIYTLDLTAKADAYGGQLSSSRDISGQITVEQEQIGFSIGIGWGA